MNPTWLIISIVAAGFLCSLTDWFFSGFLFHEKYLVYPQTWRGEPGQPETNRILMSTLLGFVTCAGFICLAARLSLTAPVPAVKLAIALWIIAPLPLIVTNALWIKMHPMTALAHSLGWLAKLIVCALCIAFLYHGR